MTPELHKSNFWSAVFIFIFTFTIFPSSSPKISILLLRVYQLTDSIHCPQPRDRRNYLPEVHPCLDGSSLPRSPMDITEHWSYYIFITLTLLPVFLVFRLLQWTGWALFVNN